MKALLPLMLVFLFNLTGKSQTDLIHHVLKINLEKEIKLLPKIGSNLVKVSWYEKDQLIRGYTQTIFYNYDSLRLCFGYDTKFYGIINKHKECKKISDGVELQVTRHLDVDEFETDSMFVYRQKERIDSVKIIRHGKLEKWMRFYYQDDQLVEKKYDLGTYTSSTQYLYSKNELIMKFKKNDLFNGQIVYHAQDSIVRQKKYNKHYELLLEKEFVVLLNDLGKVVTQREYDIDENGKKTLFKTQHYTYSRNRIKITEQWPSHSVIVKTEINTLLKGRTIETEWLNKAEKKIVEYQFLDQ